MAVRVSLHLNTLSKRWMEYVTHDKQPLILVTFVFILPIANVNIVLSSLRSFLLEIDATASSSCGGKIIYIYALKTHVVMNHLKIH